MYFIRPTWFARKYYAGAKWRFPVDERTIYLTFDDGPHPEITPRILEILKSFNAKATFFCVGENAKKYPETLQQVVAQKHALGNHTYNHLNGWKTKNETYFDNVKKCSEVISSRLYRPPYGRIKKSQLSVLRSAYTVIMWDVLSGDFDPSISNEKCLRNVISRSRNGSIVLFHDSEKAKARVLFVLPEFLEHFSEKGFSFKAIN